MVLLAAAATTFCDVARTRSNGRQGDDELEEEQGGGWLWWGWWVEQDGGATKQAEEPTPLAGGVQSEDVYAGAIEHMHAGRGVGCVRSDARYR